MLIKKIMLFLICVFVISFTSAQVYANGNKEQKSVKDLKGTTAKVIIPEIKTPKTETEIAYELTNGALFSVTYKGEKFDFSKIPLSIRELNKRVRYDEYNNQYFYDATGKPYFYSIPHRQSFYYKKGMGPGNVEAPERYKARWRQAIEDKIAYEKSEQTRAAKEKVKAEAIELKRLRNKIRNEEKAKLKKKMKNLDDVVGALD
ncbi:MAG: hypothetical protein GY804_12665 [Alphaproteobacteria bacterium]|nr:hypothetical protein [Alphaproteobacteria bacterium]